jgi:sulfatase maturation enzyme AslB (radical SAM superfamily)
MENISELIQKNKSEFKELECPHGNWLHFCDSCPIEWYEYISNKHTQSLKSLIDAVIEDEEKEISDENMRDAILSGDVEEVFKSAKQNTIEKLKAIREIL